MSTSHFFDAQDIRILSVVNNKVEQCKGLVERNIGPRGLAANSVDHVTLQSKEFCKNGNDNGSLTILGEAENDTTGLVKQAN